MAANFFNPTTNTSLGICFLALSIVFAILFFFTILWMFRVVNYPYQHSEAPLATLPSSSSGPPLSPYSSSSSSDKLYNYEMMFLFRMDYDTFTTYELTCLPSRENKIHRTSNLAVL